jgi:outer membrane usher protein FimD/PapC
MSIRQCACHKLRPGFKVWNSGPLFKTCALVFIYISLSFSFLSYSEGAETIILNIILNHESKGEFFVNLTGDGDFLIKVVDLKAMGFKDPKGKSTEIEGELYISLRSMEGVEFILNEKTLSLDITALPALLPTKIIDFMPQIQPKVLYPRDNSAFLNYGINYSAGNSFDFQGLNITNQLGIRVGDFLFLSDSSYTETPTDKQFVRLMSNITYDRRQDMQRITVGDFFASSGDLGSSVNLGGFSYSKIYHIDPYFIKNPMLDISGLISLPSEVEIYLNGMRIRTEKLSPGEFVLNNISYYGGAGVLEIVIKDSFGREQRIVYPFYFTDILLKKGLHEYSYNIGFMREDFGVESNRYSNLALSAFHRYGISDSLTFGFRAEATKDLYNLGPQTSYLIPNAGIITVSLAGSTGNKGRTGFAGSLNHTYQGRKVNTRLLINGFTKDYSTIISESSGEKTRYEAGAGIGYSTKDFGSIALDFTTIKKYQGQDRQVAAVTYSRNLSNKATIFGTFRNIREKASANEFFIGINYYPWKDTSISARYERRHNTSTEVLEAQKNPPLGEGFGYRASFEGADSNTISTNTINPFVQYNSRYGIYTAECRVQLDKTGIVNDTYQLSASGGIAYVGNTIGFSRPINDSFGLAKVGEIEGVRVYLSNEEIGRTDSSGKVFVPNLNSYYDNQVSISDKDIPINYSISEVIKYISPPFRSGSFIKFDVMKFQAITGMLKIKVNGEVKPVEFYEVRMIVDGKELTFPTGKGGEFYLENIKPGRYKSSFSYMGKTCSFDIIIPETDEMIIDLGGIVCENIH